MKNDNDNKPTGTHGIGFCGALTIALIVLKLCGVISWPWIWILAPIWIPFTVIVLIALIVAIITVKKEHDIDRDRR